MQQQVQRRRETEPENGRPRGPIKACRNKSWVWAIALAWPAPAWGHGAKGAGRAVFALRLRVPSGSAALPLRCAPSSSFDMPLRVPSSSCVPHWPLPPSVQLHNTHGHSPTHVYAAPLYCRGARTWMFIATRVHPRTLPQRIRVAVPLCDTYHKFMTLPSPLLLTRLVFSIVIRMYPKSGGCKQPFRGSTKVLHDVISSGFSLR